jgi:hypothetical protein
MVFEAMMGLDTGDVEGSRREKMQQSAGVKKNFREGRLRREDNVRSENVKGHGK